MKISEVKEHELACLVEQGMPISDYIAEKERRNENMINETYSFDNREDAKKCMNDFLEMYGGAFNPYNGRASIVEKDGKFKVETSRRRSAD